MARGNRMVACVLGLLLLAQDGTALDEQRVLELIAACGAEPAETREAAMRALQAMGPPVLPYVERAYAAQAGEAKRRLMRVLADVRPAVPWAKAFVEEDTDGRDGGMEHALRERLIDPKKAGAVLAEVVRHEAASPGQRRYALDLARRYNLPGLWPAVLEVLGREETDESQALLAQRVRPPPDALPDLLRLIPKARSSALVASLLEAARRLNADRAQIEACVGALLDEGSPDAKASALAWIRQGRVPVSVATVLSWWRSHPDCRSSLRDVILGLGPDSWKDLVDLQPGIELEEVRLAIEVVSRHKIRPAAATLLKAADQWPECRPQVLQAFRGLGADEEIRSLISGPGRPLRVSAITLAADLRLASAGPEIMKCLDDSDPRVRCAAAGAAVDLDLAPAAPKLASMIRDRDRIVRVAALKALACLKKKDATPVILDQLRSQDPDLQAAAVEVLRFGDADRALAALTTDEALGIPFLRHALAALLAAGEPGLMDRARARIRNWPADLEARVRLIRALAGP